MEPTIISISVKKISIYSIELEIGKDIDEKKYYELMSLNGKELSDLDEGFDLMAHITKDNEETNRFEDIEIEKI